MAPRWTRLRILKVVDLNGDGFFLPLTRWKGTSIISIPLTEVASGLKGLA